MDNSPSLSASDFSDPLSDPPSSPLSVLTRSPSISPRTSLAYRHSRLPSPPPSTIYSGSASPMKSSDVAEPVELEIHVNPDGAPPPKRRRVERKPRTTEYLDLGAASNQSEKDEELLQQLTHALRKKKKIVVIAGAGISVSAGSMYHYLALPTGNTITCWHDRKTDTIHTFSTRLPIVLRPLRLLAQRTWPQRLRQASLRRLRLQARLDHRAFPYHGSRFVPACQGCEANAISPLTRISFERRSPITSLYSECRRD